LELKTQLWWWLETFPASSIQTTWRIGGEVCLQLTITFVCLSVSVSLTHTHILLYSSPSFSLPIPISTTSSNVLSFLPYSLFISNSHSPSFISIFLYRYFYHSPLSLHYYLFLLSLFIPSLSLSIFISPFLYLLLSFIRFIRHCWKKNRRFLPSIHLREDQIIVRTSPVVNPKYYRIDPGTIKWFLVISSYCLQPFY
jgi:hypothetical protein